MMTHVDVFVKEMSQAKAVAAHPDLIERVYVDYLLASDEKGRLAMPPVLRGLSCYVALPYITRQEKGTPAMADLESVRKEALAAGFRGVLCRNIEQIAYYLEAGFAGSVIADAFVYTWNHPAMKTLTSALPYEKQIDEITAPYELSLKSFFAAYDALEKKVPASIVCYGRTPMMVSASCIRQTLEGCTGKRYERFSKRYLMTDRTHRLLPVTCDCRCCYNVIYNAHPLSLHDMLEKIRKGGDAVRVRLDFTVEDASESGAVLVFFEQRLFAKGVSVPPYEAWTLGRSKKSVE